MNTPVSAPANSDEELNAILTVPKEKKHLPKWTVVLLNLLPILLAGGITLGVHMHQEQQHQEMVAFVKEHKYLVDEHFSKADSVTINYDSLAVNPMGGIDFTGYLNGDKKLDFSTNIDYYNDTVELSSFSYEQGMEQYIDFDN